jgi:2'-5' RNA ligase
VRVFLALELPEEERRRLAEYLRSREWSGLGMKLVRPENLHVTLKFLGEAADARVKEVCDAQQGVSLDAPITLRMEGVTFFPPRGPIRVVAARLESRPRWSRWASHGMAARLRRT